MHQGKAENTPQEYDGERMGWEVNKGAPVFGAPERTVPRGGNEGLF